MPTATKNINAEKIQGNLSLSGISATTISATTYQNLPTDVFVTGGTYNNPTGTATFTNNTGGTFSVTGFTTGGTSSISGEYLPLSGGTVTGGTIFESGLTANTIYTDYIDFDITQSGTTSSPGRLFWDTNNNTLSLGMLSGVTQQIGEEQYYLVENQTSGTLLNGYVVRAAGTTGSSGKILIDYAIANGTIPAFYTLGVLTQTLLSGETGYVTSFGLVRNIDTTGTPYGETWSQGDILYVSTTILGGFTNVKPIVPNQDIIMAIVMESGVNGSIFVRPDVYRPFKDPQLLTVAKQNADFTSIKDAVDSIVGSSISNRYVIDVGPGIFVEDEIDLTSTPYVSIVGSNIQTTLVVPSGSTQHVFKIGISNEISFLSISGVSTGYAGIYCYDVGDFAQAHKVSMYDCDTNIWIESNTQDTKFYGEYVDFNGQYEYGVRCIGNNGFLALANMENYFNFPTGSNITYCNYATGSGATINAFVSDNVSNGVSGTTAFLIQDGSQLNVATATADGCTYGIRNPNIGSSVRFDADGVSFVNGEWDLYVESIGTFGTFGGSSSGQKIFTNSPDVYWSFLDIDNGEFEITRKASVTFTDGSNTDFTTLIFEGGTMGLISGGNITTISGFTVQADAGFGYLEKSDNSGIVRRIDWINNQITLSANTDNYIYINENSNLVSSGTRPITSYNIVLGRVVTDSTGVEFIDLSPMKAEHTSNSFDSLFTMALGPIYAFGSIVTEGTTPFTLDVTMGDYHFSTNQYMPMGGTGITFTQYYRNGTGTTWVTSATTLVNNTQYDNNGTLTGLTTGYFTKHTLYTLGQGALEHYFLVIGQNEYSTLVEAEDALLTTPPSYFTDGVTQIANIYIQEGTSGITQVEDIRPTIGFRAGGVNASSVHGNLLGLNADDHTQYLLVSGSRAMSGNLDMGANNITNVGTVDGVTVSAHAARHQFGGLDPVGSTTPSANAIPYADVSGTLNDWVSTASTTTFGKVKTSTSSTTVISDNDSRLLSSLTGGTYSAGTLSFLNNSGGTVSITGLTTQTQFLSGITANTIYTDYIDFNTGATVTQSQGRINWDAGTGTLNIAIGDATTGLLDLQVGQEEIVRVYNDEGTTLQKGEVVYVSGSQGNRPKVKRAIATSDGYSVTTLGMVDLAIPSGSEGYVTTFGIISNLNTSGFTGGTPVFLSPTVAGGFTSTKPIAPFHTVLLGYVVRVSATVGSIFVNISNGWELDEIHDVRISAVTEGDLLVRSSYSGTPVWVNSKTLPGSYTITGNTNVGGGLTANTISADTLTITNNINSSLRSLYRNDSNVTVDWESSLLTGSGPLLDWGQGLIKDSGPNLSIDWINRTLNDGGEIGAVEWNDRQLRDSVSGLSINWNLRRIFDSSGISSISYNDRRLIKSNSFTAFDWENGILTGQTNIQSSTISATTYQNLPTDIRVTGGTYSNSTGTATFTNNTGGTFNVTGFFTGGTSGVSGDYLPLSGGTVTGATNFTAGLTANTFSATTYQNYPTQDLATTLGYGISSGVNNISMGTTTSIVSDNSGSKIELDNGGNAGFIKVTTDNGASAESYINLTPNTAEIGTQTNSLSLTTSQTVITSNDKFVLDATYQTSQTSDTILIQDNGSLNIQTTTTNKPGIIIGSYNSSIQSGVTNTVIVGGKNINATQSDRLYVGGLNLFGSIGSTNSNTQILSRDGSTGNIGITDLSYITGLTSGDTFVTGVTYSANTLTISQNQGQSPINTTIGLRTKSDTVTAGSFSGNPKKYTVSFTTAYPNTNYTISITGSDNRTFTYESKSTTGFVINTNANTSLTGNVDWQTIAIGES